MPHWAQITISLGVQIILTAAGFLVLIWRLGKQHVNRLQQQRESARHQLQVQIYQELMTTIKDASEKFVEASVYSQLILDQLDAYRQQREIGIIPATPTKRTQEMIDINAAANVAVAEVISEIECWRAAIPNADIFSMAFQSASYDARNAIMEAVPLLTITLPTDRRDNSDGEVIAVPQDFSAQTLAELRMPLERYRSACSDAQAYLYDLITVSQNTLIGGFFGGEKLSPRKPLMPSSQVITDSAENAVLLHDYFRRKTPWGREREAFQASFGQSASEGGGRKQG